MIVLVFGPVASAQVSGRSTGVPLPVKVTAVTAGDTGYLLLAAVVVVAAALVVTTTSSSVTETAAATSGAVVLATDQAPGGKGRAEHKREIARSEFDR
jgi:hypothetical protein